MPIRLSQLRIALATSALICALLFARLPYERRLSCLGERALLLTAHPDDECMFFAPTVNALVKSPNTQLFSLCLSTGNADGLGERRVPELAASLRVLGIPANQSRVLNHSFFQDNMKQYWGAPEITTVVQEFVEEHNIDTILTFDQGGVSGHLNHASLPNGAGHVTGVRIAVLKTVGVLQKYTFFLEYLFNLHTSGRDGVYTSSPSDYVIGVRAMLAHKSQLVWFRWLYITFSRYMWTNEWTCQ